MIKAVLCLSASYLALQHFFQVHRDLHFSSCGLPLSLRIFLGMSIAISPMQQPSLPNSECRGTQPSALGRGLSVLQAIGKELAFPWVVCVGLSEYNSWVARRQAADDGPLSVTQSQLMGFSIQVMRDAPSNSLLHVGISPQALAIPSQCPLDSRVSSALPPCPTRSAPPSPHLYFLYDSCYRNSGYYILKASLLTL